MTTAGDMLADLNDRLNDAGNSQAGEDQKILWLNQGLRAMYPRIYKTVRDPSIVLEADVYEYALPASVGQHTEIIRVEVEGTPGRYVDIYGADIVPGLTDPILVFRDTSLPGAAGSHVRITAAAPLTEFSSSASVYDGPRASEELPVLYAMGIATSRRLDDRIDHRRFSTLQNQNGVSTADMMDVSQLWFAQFELLLERKAMPLPAPQG